MVPGESQRIADHGGVGKWLKTPLGWARANVAYDTCSRTPEYGSLVEVMCLLVWKARTTQEVAAVRATAQASLGGEKASEAFSDYQGLMDRRSTENKDEAMREKLDRLKKMETIKFSPAEGGVRKKSHSLRTVRRKR